MVEFIMTIGLPASGKTTWAKSKAFSERFQTFTEMRLDNWPDKIDENRWLWLSSDEIRKATGVSNNDIFFVMTMRAKEALRQGINVIYDATNLWRRHRMHTLQELASLGSSVYFHAEVFLQPYDVLFERNAKRGEEERVPDEVINKFAAAFEFPQMFEGWDEININKSSKHVLFSLGRCVGFNQENPHHDLTLDKHLWKAVKLAEEHHLSSIMQTAALYHDVGKIYCKTKGEDGVAHYYGHENYSAYIYAMHEYTQNWYTWNEFLDIIFLINYHMRPYHWTDKSYEKDLKLFGERRMEMLKQLHYCDEAAH